MRGTEAPKTLKLKHHNKPVPVQAYVPRWKVLRFKILYPLHGSITQLINAAFDAAIEDIEDSRKHAEAQLWGRYGVYNSDLDEPEDDDGSGRSLERMEGSHDGQD